jgi:transcriptional regulator with GAF, ATPase, and Fis domain
VTVALAHEKLARAWRDRRERRLAMERLLPMLAGSLDVRSVFEQLGRITREIIPHDYLNLLLLSEDHQRVRLIARRGGDHPIDTENAPDLPVPPESVETMDWDYFLVEDVTILSPNQIRLHHWPRNRPGLATMDVTINDLRIRVFTEMGVRSALRATVRISGKAVGFLDFSAQQPRLYTEEDAEFAMRVADHVALALAHQELAEGTRRVTAAQDRAAKLEERVQVLVQELETLSPHRALGRSRAWRDVLAQATKVAPTDTTVLITGESGTGKEVAARFIHRGSGRKDGPFVALNCAALPEQLLESELFGHEKGAFTGALNARPGKIEQASGGVLFLDEVGEMSPAVQAKFLRVLQEREYQRLGGVRTLKADVRVLAATNRNLKAAIGQGAFREDLYYRLAVFEIALPPLRERRDDILVLVDAFLEEIGRTVGRPAAGVSTDVRDTLVSYGWPGNVRELRNALERAIILCEGGLITREHLPLGIVASPVAEAPTAAAPRAAAVTLDAAEREMILQALARAGNNKSKAARLLGLTRAQLRSRIEKHGITAED